MAIRTSSRRRALAAAALSVVLGPVVAVTVSHAVEMTDLYTIEVDVDGNSADAQTEAYETALRQILVRVTGSEAAADDEQLAELFPEPGRYLLRYRQTDEGALAVTMDGDAIEAALRSAGYPVWGSDRPLTVVWLAADWGNGERVIIGADDDLPPPADDEDAAREHELRERVLTAAERRGLPVAFPLMDSEDRGAVAFSDVWGDFDGPLVEASRRYGSSSILVGRVRGNEALGDRWSYYSGGQRNNWNGSPETVIDLLADRLAEQFAFAGDAPLENVVLTVSGVESVHSFGSLQRLLEQSSVVESFRIETVAGEEIRYVVRVPGGIERLASALEFSGLLERQERPDTGEFVGGTSSGNRLDYALIGEARGPGAETADAGRSQMPQSD